MTWREHLLEAQRLGTDRAAQNLASLVTEHRIVGLVKYLDELENGFMAAASNQSLAERPGALAHAMGAVYALRVIRNQLSRLMSVADRAPGGVPRPEPEESE